MRLKVQPGLVREYKLVVVGGGEGVEKGDGGRWSVDEKEQSVHTSFPYYLI